MVKEGKGIANDQLALIAFGSNKDSNWGNVRETIQKATSQVAFLALTKPICSRFYTNPSFPAGAGPDFINAAMAIRTNLSAELILSALHEIESSAGRIRTLRWGQRVLDIDLIALGSTVLPDEETNKRWRDLPIEAQLKEAPEALILPHPRLQDRAFVLKPLAEVAPDWIHPLLGKTVLELLEALPIEDRSSVVPID